MDISLPISKPAWPRSLYWRIILGFILCIAGVLALQTAVVLWFLSRAPSEEQITDFTATVAHDLSVRLVETPALDVQRYLEDRYPSYPVPLFIVLEDGRVSFLGSVRPQESAISSAQYYYRDGPRQSLPPSSLIAPFFKRPILRDGLLVGSVGVVPQTWMQRLGWKMVGVAAVLLTGGTVLAAMFIFGPVRRRLRDLETAARRFGSGDFSARAQENGADEVVALARAFNRMAMDLSARDQQLKASDRTRRMLLADVSHELMTPLTAIRGYREVLSMSPLARDTETAHGLDVLADETQRLERLVGDLLDLARLEAGGDSLSMRDVSVENLFGRVAARHELAAKSRGITLLTAVAPGAEMLYGDPLRLEQALQNLAANAVRHTPAGGSIELRAELNGDEVLLTLRDTGAGIAPEHLPFVFDRFYKADPARRSDPTAGSGLGLSIVKAIVERHRGSVSASSAPGVATVFTIHMPLGTP